MFNNEIISDMKLTKNILIKVLIGGLFIALSYLAIFGIYKHSNEIARWLFRSNSVLFFPILFKILGIIWCLAFLRIGFDWVVFNMNPFINAKKENE